MGFYSISGTGLEASKDKVRKRFKELVFLSKMDHEDRENQNYFINDDLTITVFSSVLFKKSDIEELDIQFKYVRNNFDCLNLPNLRSTKGFPWAKGPNSKIYIDGTKIPKFELNKYLTSLK